MFALIYEKGEENEEQRIARIAQRRTVSCCVARAGRLMLLPGKTGKTVRRNYDVDGIRRIMGKECGPAK